MTLTMITNTEKIATYKSSNEPFIFTLIELLSKVCDIYEKHN
jgi:hypothetical protein